MQLTQPVLPLVRLNAVSSGRTGYRSNNPDTIGRFLAGRSASCSEQWLTFLSYELPATRSSCSPRSCYSVLIAASCLILAKTNSPS